MRRFFRVCGWLSLGLAVASLLLAVASWPPGGLFFALPYLFLMVAVALGLGGAVLLFLSRAPREERSVGGAA